MDNETRKKDALIASATAGSFAAIAISVTLFAIYRNIFDASRMNALFKFSIVLALINTFSGSITVLSPLEYNLLNVFLKQLYVVSFFFIFIVVGFEIFYTLNPLNTMRFAIVPIMLAGLVTSIFARNKAFNMIYPQGPKN